MAEKQKKEIGHAKASPTKEFFVRMLTRDIELGDALLDLLDNCLDGILRSNSMSSDANRPYAGFRAELTMSPEGFCIRDNCGGIPLETAKKYAFAMGRPSEAADDTPATIGMYGIGMKRAIFKLGTNAVVESRFADEEGFYVEFTPDWMTEDGWDDLTVYSLNGQTDGVPGTCIEVMELHEEARKCFSDEDWIDAFRKTVARHYALILDKGFEVIVGTPSQINEQSATIEPESFRLLQALQADDGGPAIQPFIYSGDIDDVRVEIFAGLYRELLSPEELEIEEETRGTRDDAGWTVACNDRIVIWKDKTRLTGWGEASVPNYHGQFIPITGIVLLYADDPRLLPLTTTKRGIDASSNVYSVAKDFMREATKSLTAFTNKWKKFPQQRDALYRGSTLAGLPELRKSVQDVPLQKLHKVDSVRRFAPKLPTPAQEKTDARISYLASKKEIETVSRFFFAEEKATNEEVGKRSFKLALEQAEDEFK